MFIASRRDKIIIASVLVLLLGTGYFIFDLLVLKSSSISRARALLQEYKIAKAQNILEKAKLRMRKNDPELDTLLAYSQIKLGKYEEASRFIDKNIKRIPGDFKPEFLELVEILNVNDQTDLLVKLIDKARALKLEQDFFIAISQRRSDVKQEFQLLEAGLAYLDQLKQSKSKKQELIASDRLENYMLRRCMEVADMKIGAKDYKGALAYLSKAQSLGVVKNSSLKDDFYLSLALTYKNLHDFDKAWENMQLAAKLGNQRAKGMIEDMHKNYR